MDSRPIVHPVNSGIAENGKLEQVVSNCGIVCLLRFSRRFLAQPSRPANRIPVLLHQLNVLQCSVKRPRLSAVDRWLWVRLSRNRSARRAALKLLKPATVIEDARWHGTFFKHTYSLLNTTRRAARYSSWLKIAVIVQ